MNSSKYLINVAEQEVFILAPKKLFEELLIELYELSKTGEKGKDGATELLAKLYTSKTFRSLFENWEYLSWTHSIETFKNHLEDESFFYVDSGKEAYYFKLFSCIKQPNEFIGGFLHFLVKHFDQFNNFHFTSNDANSFFYNELITKIISTVILGEPLAKKEKSGGNYELSKELSLNAKTYRIGMYYDRRKDLYFINTFFKKSEKNKC